MAELAPTDPRTPPPGWRADLAAYRAVMGSRIEAQRSHRASFRVDLVGSVLVGVVELVEVWVLFHSVTRIGGLELAQIVLVFGLADFCFSMADLSFGHCDDLHTFVRTGTLEVFYLRPQPLLLQLVTSDVSLKRIARGCVGAAAVVVGLVVNDVDWSPSSVLLLVLALLSGYAIFAAQFVSAAGLQFFVIDGAELTNAYVYGGRYASTQPASVWSKPLRVAFGFFFPMAFTAYLPTLELLGLPGPAWLPSWLAWCAPVAAVWAWLFALWAWRVGVRHYQGGGG